MPTPTGQVRMPTRRQWLRSSSSFDLPDELSTVPARHLGRATDAVPIDLAHDPFRTSIPFRRHGRAPARLDVTALRSCSHPVLADASESGSVCRRRQRSGPSRRPGKADAAPAQTRRVSMKFWPAELVQLSWLLRDHQAVEADWRLADHRGAGDLRPGGAVTM